VQPCTVDHLKQLLLKLTEAKPLRSIAAQPTSPKQA
jgi:hypothetical protein